jgi:hypothetical protein
MPAPKNNQFWKNRSVHGREKLFKTPELLWQAAQEYFNWVDGHPWYKVSAIKSGDFAKEMVKEPVARPYTITGFLIYCDASESYWRKFKATENLPEDFFTVIERIEQIIYTQKFEGAAVGAFNANIIARDLGLVEKGELTGKDGVPLTGLITMFELPKNGREHATAS